MKFIFDIPGQTCNRFWSFIDLVGEAIVKRERVYVLFPDKNFDDYPTLLNNTIIRFPFYRQACDRNGLYYKMIFNRIAFRFYDSRIGKYFGFVRGWNYCGNDNYYPQVKDKVLALFHPSDQVQNDVNTFLDTYKRRGAFLVGVHMRQGDYKTWRGGRYYLSQQEYAELLKFLREMYIDQNVVFYIASNTKIDEKQFRDIPYISLQNATAAQDLEALSKCHRIIGPLSTFSRWASLKGAVPLFLLERGLTPKSDSDFKVIKSLFKYENGDETIGDRFSV